MAQVESLRTENKFKNTEVGEIPVEWEVCRLGDYAYIKARIGWRGLSASEYTEEGPLFISGNHISGTKILWDKCDHLSKFRYDESPEIKLKNGDVIISKDGTIGRLGYIDHLPQEATIGGTMMLIRPQERFFHSKYVYYYFQGSYFQNLIKEKVSGSSIPHIFQRDIVNLRIPLISLEEQKKIAQILSSIDWAIEKNAEIIEKTKQLKKGLMQELFFRGIGHKKFKKTKIGEMPQEWKVVKIGDISEIHRGASPRPIGDPKYFGKGPGWIRISDVTKADIYLRETEDHLSDLGVSKSVCVKPGDLIMSICASIGKPVIVEMDACIHDGFVFFDHLSEKVNSLFLLFWLKKNENYFSAQGQHGTQKNLNTRIIRNAIIFLPPLAEQKEIADILFNVNKKIEMETRHKEKLEALKKGLMQVLLTGKVRVK